MNDRGWFPNLPRIQERRSVQEPDWDDQDSGVSSEEEELGQRFPQDRLWGINIYGREDYNQNYKLKIDLPTSFHGKINLEAFLDWVKAWRAFSII